VSEYGNWKYSVKQDFLLGLRTRSNASDLPYFLNALVGSLRLKSCSWLHGEPYLAASGETSPPLSCCRRSVSGDALTNGQCIGQVTSEQAVPRWQTELSNSGLPVPWARRGAVDKLAASV
tara:strand:- start:76558 stop:76917 length:360 start_codon:yes stop_codon:yes gene_type:complete